MVAAFVLLGSLLLGCTPKPAVNTEAPVSEEPPAQVPTTEVVVTEAPPAPTEVTVPPTPEKTQITIVIAEDPPSFNRSSATFCAISFFFRPSRTIWKSHWAPKARKVDVVLEKAVDRVEEIVHCPERAIDGLQT